MSFLSHLFNLPLSQVSGLVWKYFRFFFSLLSGFSRSFIPKSTVWSLFLLKPSSSPNRTQSVKVTGQHQYESKAFFLRDPFVVKFQSNKTSQWTQNTTLFSNNFWHQEDLYKWQFSCSETDFYLIPSFGSTLSVFPFLS